MKMLQEIEKICVRISKLLANQLNMEYKSFISRMKKEYEEQNPLQFQKGGVVSKRAAPQSSASHEASANRRKEPIIPAKRVHASENKAERKESVKDDPSKGKSIEKVEVPGKKPSA